MFDQGSAITFSVTVSDAQDQPNDVTLNWDLSGSTFSTTGATSSGTAQFSDSSLGYGTHTLTVSATDTDGFTTDDIITFTVNGLPSQPSVTITPNPVYTNQDLTALATGSIDPEGNIPTYTYDWHLNGNSSGNTATVLPASLTNKGETWTIYATPTDGISFGTPGSESITISNTPPTLSTVLITEPNPVYNDDLLTCLATVTDPDETVIPTYEWTISGNAVGFISTLDLSTITAHPTDIVTCTVTATDTDSVQAIGSAFVTIDNRHPSVSGVAITPNTLYTNSMATCGFTASDPDGDSLTNTVEWVANGATVIGTGATFQLTNVLVSPGDVLGCRATSNDGLISDTKTGLTVNILNTPPSLTVAITGSDTTSSGLLTCGATASDIDDSQTPSLSYLWSNTTQSSTLGSANTLQLTPSMAVEGDEIVCLVTATDLNGGTTTASDSLTITGCYSLLFDGNDQVAGALLPALQDFTVEAWVSVSASTGYTARIFDIDGGNGYDYWLMYISLSCEVKIDFRQGNGIVETNLISASTVCDSAWHHLAFERNGADITLYVDGIIEDTVNFSAFTFQPTLPMSVGFTAWSSASATQHFQGLINGVHLTQRAKYQSQFTPGSLTTDPDTLVLWTMSEGSGTVVADISGNGYDGTNNGASWEEICPDFDDLDGDGFDNIEDCDDSNANIYPYAGDIYGDGTDSDCDGMDCEAGNYNGGYYANCYGDYGSVSGFKGQCIGSGYGGLASSDSAALNTFLASLVSSTGGDSAIIDGTDSVQEGIWEWESGLPWSYTNWDLPDEPNNSGVGEDCLQIYGSTARWNDVLCAPNTNSVYGPQYYICQLR